MSRTLKFYGASDDLFEIEDSTGKATDEIGSFGSIAAVKVANEHAGLIVVALYDPPKLPRGMPGCWTIGVCPLGEGVAIPDWNLKISLEPGSQYSTLLTMEVPDDVIVSQVGGSDDED